MMWSQQQQIKMQCIEFISSSGISRTDERSSTFRLFIFFYAPFCCCSFPWIYTVYHDIDSGRSTLWENLLNTVRIIRKLIYFFWPIFFEQAQFHFTRCLNIVIINAKINVLAKRRNRATNFIRIWPKIPKIADQNKSKTKNNVAAGAKNRWTLSNSVANMDKLKGRMQTN